MNYVCAKIKSIAKSNTVFVRALVICATVFVAQVSEASECVVNVNPEDPHFAQVRQKLSSMTTVMDEDFPGRIFKNGKLPWFYGSSNLYSNEAQKFFARSEEVRTATGMKTLIKVAYPLPMLDGEKPEMAFFYTDLRGGEEINCDLMLYNRDRLLASANARNIVQNKPLWMTIGQTLIELEKFEYTMKGEEYPIEEVKAKYFDLLRDLRRRFDRTEDLELIDRISAVRNSLNRQGLSNYCRDFVSLKDFFVNRCGNCQTQTALFVALLLDLSIQGDDENQLGIQIFKDHVRPVLLKDEGVLDLVYGSIAPDTGDRIYPLQTFLYNSLRMQLGELPPEVLDVSDLEDELLSLNESRRERRQRLQQRADQDLQQTRLSGDNLQLRDFFGFDEGLTDFNSGEVPEFASLDLSGDLSNPSSQTLGVVGFRGGMQTLNDYRLRCDEDRILRDFLNAEELEDLSYFLSRPDETVTPEVFTKYRGACPGYGFSRAEDSVSLRTRTLPIPGKIIDGIDKMLPYEQKVNLLEAIYIDSAIEKIESFIENLNRPIPQMIDGLLDISNENFFFTSGAFFQMIERHGRVYEFREIYSSLYRSLDRLRTRVKRNPLEFLAKLNEFDFLTLHMITTYIGKYSLVSGSGGVSNFHIEEVTAGSGISPQRVIDYYDLFDYLIPEAVLTDQVRIVLSTEKVEPLELELEGSLSGEGEDETAGENENLDVSLSRVHLSESQQASFDRLCKEGHRIVQLGIIAIPCPQGDPRGGGEETTPMPEELVVSKDMFAFMASVLQSARRPNTGRFFMRLFSALDPITYHEMIEQSDDRTFSFEGSPFDHFVYSASYVLSPGAPIVSLSCSERLGPVMDLQRDTECNSAIREMSFSGLSDAGRLSRPSWVESSLDYAYWKQAARKANLSFRAIQTSIYSQLRECRVGMTNQNIHCDSEDDSISLKPIGLNEDSVTFFRETSVEEVLEEEPLFSYPSKSKMMMPQPNDRFQNAWPPRPGTRGGN